MKCFSPDSVQGEAYPADRAIDEPSVSEGLDVRKVWGNDIEKG